MTTATVPTRKLCVLIAEDNQADVLLIQEALREHGLDYQAEVATDGEKAFTFLRRFDRDAGMLLDLVLLDLNLGTHHGTEILAYIRNTPGLFHLPVVVLTSSDSPLDRERVRILGGDLYLRKPIDLDEFLKIGGQIAQVLRQRGPSPSSESAAR